jgi:hypothetical protein
MENNLNPETSFKDYLLSLNKNDVNYDNFTNHILELCKLAKNENMKIKISDEYFGHDQLINNYNLAFLD